MKGILKKFLAISIVIIMLLINCSQVASYAVTFYSYRKRSDKSEYYYESNAVYDYQKDYKDNYVNDYYCLEGGAHIGNDNNEQSESGYSVYNILGKNASNVETDTGIKLRADVTYNAKYKYTNDKNKSLNAIKFLVRNMYLVSSDTTNDERNWMKEHLNKLINEYHSNDDYKNTDLKESFVNETDDEFIATIQQFAIWKFVEPAENATNEEKEYYQNAIKGPDDLKKIYKKDENDTKIYLTDAQCKAGFALYSTLCAAAIDNNSDKSITETKNNKCEITVDNEANDIEAVTGQSNTYKTRTIKITDYNNVESLKIDSFTGTGIEIKNWKIINAETGSEISNNFSQLSQGKFYIQFTTSTAITNLPTITLKYSGSYNPALSSYSANIYYKQGKQPLLEIAKKLKKETINSRINFYYEAPDYDFDLSLTKEITDIYRYNQETKKYEKVYNSENDVKRLKNINKNTIEKNGTAQYIMDKTPMSVIPGDIIRYKISVYNEGNTEGVIKQISDYLPDGLEYVKVTSGSSIPEYASKNYANETDGIVDSSNSRIIKYNFGNGITIEPTYSKTGDILGDDKIIYIECRVKNNTKQGDILRNFATISDYGYKDEFKNYISSSSSNKSNGKTIDKDSEQDNITTYTAFNNATNEAINNNGITSSDLASVDKGDCVSEDDEDFEQVEVKGFDLALRKFITMINNDLYTGEREPRITRFRSGKTTADYYQKKTPLKVQEGDTVLYTIRIFNEGYIDGYAWEITDYLPANLKLKSGSTVNELYGWVESSTSDGLTVVKSTELKDTLIKAGNGSKGFNNTKTIHSQDVQIECEVIDVADKNGLIITNMAEISDYGYNAVVGISTDGQMNISKLHSNVLNDDNKGIDIDSQSKSNLLGDLTAKGYSANGAGYRQYEKDVGKDYSTDTWKYYVGVEDDDDFENLKVVNTSFDLALRKYITKVNDENVAISRVPEINSTSVDALRTGTTARYFHTKDPVTVKTGNTVTYKLRVYNEGDKEGVVKELVDYLPEGLELKEEGLNNWYTDKNSDGTVKKNADGSTTIRREEEFTVAASNNITGYNNYVEHNGTVAGREEFWQDIELECKVTSVVNGKVLTNVAEISKYGYMDDTNNYVQANEERIDIDSENNNVFTKDTKVQNIDKYYYYRNYMKNKIEYTGEQDDDDFESLIVSSTFDEKLTLIKTDENETEISGSSFRVSKGKLDLNILANITTDQIDENTVNAIKNMISSISDTDSGTDIIDGHKTYDINNLVALTNYLYVIQEEQSPDGYENILEGYVIAMVSSIDENGTLSLQTTNSEYNRKLDKGFIILKENADGKSYTMIDGTDDLYNQINVELITTGTVPEIKVTIPNPKVDGSYNFRIMKVDENGHTIDGITEGLAFTYKRTDNVEKDDGTVETNVRGPFTLKVKENGYGSYNNIKIKGKGTDVIEITEVENNNNRYIELEDKLMLNITKDIDSATGKYKVTNIAFVNGSSSGTETSISAKLKNGKAITVNATLNTTTNTVTVTIENDEITGSYGLQIAKIGENSNVVLNGVTFSSEDNEGNVQENLTTVNGIATVATKSIEKEGTDWYKISEINVGNNEYVKLDTTITVYVEKKNDGLKYYVSRYSLKPITNSSEDVHKISDVELTMNEDGLITLTVSNEPIKGRYALKLRKLDNETQEPISGVGFTVTRNGAVKNTAPTTTNDLGRMQIGGVYSITKNTVNEVDEFVVTEINLNNKPYIKLKDPLTIYVHKGRVGNSYKVTGVSINKEEANGVNAIETVNLENNQPVYIETSLVQNTVFVNIPNEPVNGTYDLELLKTKEDGETPLSNVTFSVVKGEGNQAETIVDKQTTGDNGIIQITKNEKITDENVNVKDVYTIIENSTNNAFLKITNQLKVYVTKERVDNEYKVTAVSFEKDSVNKEADVTFSDGTTLKANADITSDGIVRITIPNKEIVGNYGLEILKTAEDDKPLEGVQFKVTEGEGESLKEISLSKDTTDENGKLTVFTKDEGKITSENVNKKDVFTITEVKTDDSYIALPEALKVFVTKGLNENKIAYEVTSYSFEENETKTTKNITLPNGKEITVSLDCKDNLISVTIPNHKIEGKYDLELIKIDQKDGVSVLPGVTFDIKTMKGTEEVKLYSVDGIEINTKGLTTNSEGKIVLSNVKITEGASYNFEITETKVPDGYVMLKDKIKLSFNTKVDNIAKTYVLDSAKVSSLAELNSSSNKLTIKVQNGQFDLALRKYISSVTVSAGTTDEKKITVPNRVPVFKVNENGEYVYEHSKDTVVLGNQNVVEYTLRVYNEGSIAGYAKEIKDDIPDGLEFLPDDETNKKYGWKLLDEKGNEVKEVNKAKYIVTDYLSKEKETEKGENLISAFNTKDYADGKIKEPAYKEVKVAFKVNVPSKDDRVIINKAQISDDSDEDGNDITDKDSTPDEWIDGEDDQDIEKVKVQTFDLALRKWVTKAIVIEDGKENVIDTGHKAEDDPEEIVKVDLKDSKINNIVVKFEYKIRVTNEGEIAGYAKEISDYIPEGLKFNVADNPNWKETEGKIVTQELENTLLQPGDTAEVSVVLTWINKKDNMGLKLNVAEISKDYNIYGSPDIDSTPNNKVTGEDDIDDAPVLITVKTGQAVTYVGLVIAVLAILGSGVVVIKKYILK